MQITIITQDDYNNGLITRKYNTANHDIMCDNIVSIIEDSERLICSECNGAGVVIRGEHDNEEEVKCICK